MICLNCEAEWKIKDDAAPPAKCPFCGENPQEKKPEPKSYDNSKDALAAIFKQFGADVLLGKLNSYFADFAPSVNNNVKKLVYSVNDSGASKALKASLNGSQEDKERAVKLAVRNLTDAFIAQEMAENIIFEFTNALGWKIAKPAPKPAPAAPAPQPQPAPAPVNKTVSNNQTASNQTTSNNQTTAAAPAPIIIKPLSPPTEKVVEIINVTKVYDGGIRAVDNINFVVGRKEFVVILGPSGCGKTTLLKMIVGHEPITSGQLKIMGEVYNNDVKRVDRNISYTSQDYINSEKRESKVPLLGSLQAKARLEEGALAFGMTVYENIAYELQSKKVPKAEIEKRVNEAARILDMEKLLDRKLTALSTGQMNRVAMGRAMVRNPYVYIFDDVLACLDPGVRAMMRAEFSDMHLRLNATTIFATKDYNEAMSMATKIIVMKDGKIEQIESPLYIYNHPANYFVARFMGNPSMNILYVTVREESGSIMLDEGSFKIKADPSHYVHLKSYVGLKIHFGIRSEDLILCENNTANSIALKITVVEPLGSDINLRLTTNTQPLIARTHANPSFKVGDTVYFVPNMNKARYFDCDTEVSILPLPV